MTNYVKWLEKWYKDNCYDEWEQSYGVKIDTLDNPGWMVTIDIIYTELEDKEFPMLKIDNSDDDWVQCKVEGGQFVGAGDKTKLSYIITQFKEWVERC